MGKKNFNFKIETIDILQGCPFSPYLFILIIIIIFRNIHAEINYNIDNNYFDRVIFSKILYTDNTLKRQGYKYISFYYWKGVQKYNLKLNQNKYCVLTMNK